VRPSPGSDVAARAVSEVMSVITSAAGRTPATRPTPWPSTNAPRPSKTGAGAHAGSLDVQVPLLRSDRRLGLAAVRVAGRARPIRGMRHESDPRSVRTRCRGACRRRRASWSPCHADPCALLMALKAQNLPPVVCYGASLPTSSACERSCPSAVRRPGVHRTARLACDGFDTTLGLWLSGMNRPVLTRGCTRRSRGPVIW
jgi:hypothetical protein